MSVHIFQDASFDAETTQAMGKAFERACETLRNCGETVKLQEIIAKRIIEVAKSGERDPILIYEKALKAMGVGQTPVRAVCSVDRTSP